MLLGECQPGDKFTLLDPEPGDLGYGLVWQVVGPVSTTYPNGAVSTATRITLLSPHEEPCDYKHQWDAYEGFAVELVKP